MSSKILTFKVLGNALWVSWEVSGILGLTLPTVRISFTL